MRVRDLGPLELESDDGRPRPLPPRLRLLLGRLLANHGRRVDARELAALLWPTGVPASWSGRLHTLVWRLRRLIDDLAAGSSTRSSLRLLGEDGGYAVAFVPRAEAVLDSAAFRDLARRGSAALPDRPAEAVAVTVQALALWRGSYLGGLGDEPWALARREELGEVRLGLLETRWQSLLSTGAAQRVVEETANVDAGMTLRETPWELRMRAQLALRRKAEALSTYRTIRDALVDQLGIEPGASLRALQYQALADLPEDVGEAARTVVTPARTGTTGPAQGRDAPAHVSREPLRPPPERLSRVLGREREVSLVLELLSRPSLRLLTLLGPGGVGKTSLALHLVNTSHVQELFPGGILWVDLASLHDARLVLPTLSQGLGQHAEPGVEPMASLVEQLRHQTTLLVLDNMEHLLAAGPDLAAVLARCPGVKALVTTRGALLLRDEHRLPIGPLALPPAGPLNDPSTLTASASVSLFVERARAVVPDFHLSAENQSAVRDVCVRLDGLPLALELAAARMDLFSPQTLLARLSSGLQLLRTSARDLPDRQRTLVGTLDWSRDLLAPTERRLFARLACFSGGATVDAVEAVCMDGPEDEDPGAAEPDVPGLLSNLAAQSLIETSTEPGPRVRLLQTVCEYAASQLTEPEWSRLRRRHFEHYLELATGAARQLPGADRVSWLDRLDVERQNLREALRWARLSGSPVQQARLANALGWLWYFRGPLEEGRGALGAALSRLDHDAPEEVRAIALWHAGRLAHLQGDEDEARELLETSVELWRVRAEGAGLAYALSDLGQVRWAQGDDETGRALGRDSVTLFRRMGDTWGLGLALQDLAQTVISSGQHDEAEALYEEILATYTELDDPWGQALPLIGLGRVAMARGYLDRARQLLEQSRFTFERLEDRRMVAYVLIRLGQLERRGQRVGPAGDLYREALLAWQEQGNRVGMTWALAGLAGVASCAGRWVEAARLDGAAAGAMASMGRVLSRPDLADHQHHLAAARAALGTTGYAEAYGDGERRGFRWAVEHCLVEHG